METGLSPWWSMVKNPACDSAGDSGLILLRSSEKRMATHLSLPENLWMEGAVWPYLWGKREPDTQLNVTFTFADNHLPEPIPASRPSRQEDPWQPTPGSTPKFPWRHQASTACPTDQHPFLQPPGTSPSLCHQSISKIYSCGPRS